MLQNVIKVLTKYGYLFADGVWITIELSLITVACSSILGSLMAILRRSRLGVVRFITFSNRNVGSALSLVLMVLIIISIGLLRKADPKGEGGALW